MGFDPMSVIPLRGDDAFVPQQSRNRPDGRVMFQKSNRESISESMRVNVNTGLSTDGIQCSPKAFDAGIQVTLPFAAPKEVVLVFNRHREQSFHGGRAKDKRHVVTGFQRTYQKPACFQVKATPFKFRDIGNAKARIEQEQHERLGAKPVPFVLVDRITGANDVVNFRPFERKSTRRFVLHLLHTHCRVLRHPVSVFAETTEAPQTFKFFPERLAARLCGGHGAIAVPPAGPLEQSRAIWSVFLLHLAASAGSETANQIHRNLAGIKTIVRVAKANASNVFR
jgi:hypothetical protein